ncbi:MAG: hypothetical protein M3R35_07235 [Candidatus Eremiobacteraeota bacterium]|nr:hypothetical protein [Candidatus Eremiobacteraeota bacterium]
MSALTPLVGSLIFKTARALGLDLNADREALLEAIERDSLFTGANAADVWERRYAVLDPVLRRRIVDEALARLRGTDA